MDERPDQPGRPSTFLMIALAAYAPCCMATWATPGTGLPAQPESRGWANRQQVWSPVLCEDELMTRVGDIAPASDVQTPVDERLSEGSERPISSPQDLFSPQLGR